MLWMTQINQAVGYKVEVEHFRRIRSECSADTPGCNMGRMYWQTNDMWQGASWAAIDFTGRYKMVQYYTGKFYAPLLVSAYCVHWHDCHVYFINDLPNDAIAPGQGSVTLALHSWKDGKLNEWKVPFTSTPASANEIWNSTFTDLLKQGGCGDATECVLTMKAYNGSTLVSSNDLYLAPFFDVTTFRNPELQISSASGPHPSPRAGKKDSVALSSSIHDGSSVAEDGLGFRSFDVVVSADHLAAFVWLETKYDGYWSDNGFLMTEPNITLQFFTTANITKSQLTSDMMRTAGNWWCDTKAGLWSLFDTSQEYSSGN
jgi:beta-mannosidase